MKRQNISQKKKPQKKVGEDRKWNIYDAGLLNTGEGENGGEADGEEIATPSNEGTKTIPRPKKSK